MRLPARRTMVESGMRRAVSIIGTPTGLAHLRFPTHPIKSISAMVNTLTSPGRWDKTSAERKFCASPGVRPLNLRFCLSMKSRREAALPCRQPGLRCKPGRRCNRCRRMQSSLSRSQLLPSGLARREPAPSRPRRVVIILQTRPGTARALLAEGEVTCQAWHPGLSSRISSYTRP